MADKWIVRPNKAMPRENEGFDVTRNGDGTLKVVPRDAFPRADKGFEIKPAGSFGDTLAEGLAPYLLWLVIIPLVLPLTMTLYLLPGYIAGAVIYNIAINLIHTLRDPILSSYVIYLIITAVCLTINIYILTFILKCSILRATVLTFGGFFSIMFVLGSFVMAVANQVALAFVFMGLANLIAYGSLKQNK